MDASGEVRIDQVLSCILLGLVLAEGTVCLRKLLDWFSTLQGKSVERIMQIMTIDWYYNKTVSRLLS